MSKNKKVSKKKTKRKPRKEPVHVSGWHFLDDKRFDKYMEDLGLMYYQNKHLLDEETWTDFVSFQTEDF